MDNKRPTWAEIDLKAIRHNIKSIRKTVAPASIMAIVKANAYGHGLLEISRVCNEEKVDFLGVATLDEAIAIRDAGIEIPVLVLGSISGEFARDAVAARVSVTVFETRLARQMSDAGVKLGREALLHIKLDSGMGRLGFTPDRDSLEEVIRIANLPYVRLEGIFTHFAVAEISDKTFTYEQLQLYLSFIERLKQRGINIPIKHSANSAAMLQMPSTRLDMVRAGIALYGLYPEPSFAEQGFDLIPAMTLKSRVSFVKTLKAGQTVSYGRTFTCSRDTRIATVPIGYADGYSRLVSNRAWAMIKGYKVPLIGTVCMDQCMFDISRAEGVAAGDEVILFGRGEYGITADDLAKIMGTINYEIVCMVSSRVPRIYIQ